MNQGILTDGNENTTENWYTEKALNLSLSQMIEDVSNRLEDNDNDSEETNAEGLLTGDINTGSEKAMEMIMKQIIIITVGKMCQTTKEINIL